MKCWVDGAATSTRHHRTEPKQEEGTASCKLSATGAAA